MKYRYLLLLLITSCAAFGQIEYTAPIKKWNPIQYRFSGGYNIYNPTLTDYQTILKLAKNATEVELPADIDQFNRRNDSQQGSLGNLILTASAAYSPGNVNDKTVYRSRMVQFSIGYQDISTFEAAYSINQKLFANTDSSLSRDFFANGRQKTLMLEGAYLRSTDQERAVYLYAGLGLQLGMSLSSKLEVNTNRSYLYSSSDSSNTTFIPKVSSLSGVSYLNTGLAIPFGLHARIWKNWGVAADFRYVLGYSLAFGASGYGRSYMQAGLGLCYSFGKFPERKPEADLDDY